MMLDAAGLPSVAAAFERNDRSAPMDAKPPEEKQTLTVIERLRVPIGGQEIELQQLDYIHGGMSQMRVRIREGKRFTIFDIDPVTARLWGEAMVRWSRAHEGADGAAAP